MCDEGASTLINSRRALALQRLAERLHLDAILLITGFDGCYSLQATGLVEWLCDCASAPPTDFRAAALEEGLFVAMPSELAWHVDDDVISDDVMAEDTVCALDRLLAADPSTAAAAAATTPAAAAVPATSPQPAAAAADGSGDVDMPAASSSPTSSPAADADVDDADAGRQPQHRFPPQPPPRDPQDVPTDGKLSLLLQLRPQLRRVGIALGVEVLGGVQQQVPVANVFRWPLLMAAAEKLGVPTEQLFQEIVDITPSLRPLLGHVDGTLLSNTLRQRRPLLTRAWLESLAVCARRNATPKLDLTEAAIAAPITDFVSGCGCRLKPGQYQPLAIPPRVLFGTRTCHHEALSCPVTTLRSQAAKQGAAVLHATVEAADACSPLRVARTIFFSQGAGAAHMPLQLRLRGAQQQQQQQQHAQDDDMGVCPAQPPAPAAAAADAATAAGGHAAAGAATTSGEDAMCRCDSGAANNSAGGACAAKQQQQPSLPEGGQPAAAAAAAAAAAVDFEVDHTDLFDLMCWYWAAVDAAWQCMEFYATQPGATWPAAQALGAQVFWTAAAAAQLVPPPCQQQLLSSGQQPSGQQQQWAPRPKLQLQLFSWDGGPRPMPSGLHLEQHNSRFKTLRVTVSGLRSRSAAHPGMALGSVLYMDSFADLPSMAGASARLVNLTLTHCPTYTFDFWGSEAALNNQRVAAFRRHLQLQLQSQLQGSADSQAQQQAAALRRSAEDPAALRLQLQQQGLKQGGKAKGGQRRSSLGQQQQMLLLQQLATAGNGRGGSSQQQQKGSKGSKGTGSQPDGGAVVRSNKHTRASTSSCCGDDDGGSGSGSGRQPGDSCTPYSDCSNGQQATKRSCCGSSSSQGLGAGGAAAAGALLFDGSMQPGEFSPAPSPGPAAAAAATPTAPAAIDGSGSSAAAAAAAGPAAAGATGAAVREPVAAAQCWRQLGRLMVPPGEMPGEVALVLTGAMKLAVMDGPLYPHSNGLVFVSRPTKVHVLLLDQIEAVWLQDFASRIPGYPDLGPCIVLRGRQPCCGLMPAVHMTDNRHMAIPLRSMSKACSQHWVTAVLPAWQAAASVVKPSKGASTPWPLPEQFQPFYGYWLAGPRKRYMLPQPDESMDQLMLQLDRPPASHPPPQHAHPQAH